MKSHSRWHVLLVVAAAAAACGAAAAKKPSQVKGEAKMTVTKTLYGKMDDGAQVDQYTLTNGKGLTVKVVTYGAIITSIETPDRNGKTANITLHRDSLQDYLAGHPYFGCVAGRFANRIAKGKFTIDGKEHILAANDGKNHLHGGTKGFDKYVWQAKPVEGPGFVGVMLTRTSPDGEEGYPGNLAASVTYSVNDKNELKMEYSAATDKPTHVNLTNHAYWNLGGAGSGDILKHELTINADRYLPVNDMLIPLGEPKSVEGTPMDFTAPHAIGERIAKVKGGYDHAYILNARKPGEELAFTARLYDPKSGRTMEIHTSEPSVQFYTGNFLDGTLTADGGKTVYRKHAALCLETQHYPDSPNRPEYPSTLLVPGQTYKHVTVHKFGVNK